MYQNKIRYFCLLSDIPLKVLALETGVSIGHLSHLQNGTRQPSKAAMEVLAKALNKTVQQVFYDDYTAEEAAFMESKGFPLTDHGAASGCLEGGGIQCANPQ